MAPVDSRDYVLSTLDYSVLEPPDVRNTVWLVNTPSKHKMLTQSWSNAGPASQLSTVSTPRVCWAAFNSIAIGLVVLTAGGEFKLTPTQCLLNVGPTSPVLASIHSALVSTSCWRNRHDALNQSWVNVGPPCVTLAHIQRGAKHDTVTQYWAQYCRQGANISPALGQRLVFAGVTSAASTSTCTIETAGQTERDRHTEQTEVNQHVPTSVYRGGDIIRAQYCTFISNSSQTVTL